MTEMQKEFVDMINDHRGIIYKVCHLYGKERDYNFREDLNELKELKAMSEELERND